MPKDDASGVLEILDVLYRNAQMQFGPALKGRWFYDRDGCPGCGREIDEVKIKKKKKVDKALSINAFIYREHGVLIAYLLCGKCAKEIMDASKKDRYTKLPLHAEIEKNLKQAFVKHLGH